MNPFNPIEMMRLTCTTAMMVGQAQMVITLGLMGMLGVWSVTPSENQLMVSEKLKAAAKAGGAAQRAMLAGKSPASIAEAALVPIFRATASNVRRLSARGPKLPQ